LRTAIGVTSRVKWFASKVNDFLFTCVLTHFYLERFRGKLQYILGLANFDYAANYNPCRDRLGQESERIVGYKWSMKHRALAELY
jgi:hypothetical protein